MKKIFAAMLALLMIATLFSCKKEEDGDVDLDKYKQEEVVIEYVERTTVVDEATGKVETERFYFETLDTETIAITGYVGKDATHTLKIPKELDVSDPNDKTKTDVRTVTTIAAEAFYYCSKINAIEFPETVTTIGNYAFAGCALIQSLEIPATVTSIGDGAFFGCTGMTSLTFAEGSALAFIGKYAFSECTGIGEVSIPASVQEIGASAFKDCDALTTVAVAEGVKTIGDGAFIRCKKLESITLPASVQKIGLHAFSESEALYSDGAVAPAGSYAAAYLEEMNLSDPPIVLPDDAANQ